MSTPITGMRIDPELKARATELFEAQGLTFSEGVKLLLEDAVTKGRSGAVLGRAPRQNFIAEYLEPIMNERYEKPRSIGRSPSWLRARLRMMRGAL